MGVGEDVPHMEMPRHRRRRGVDRVDGLAVARVPETVDSGGLPRVAPFVFESVDSDLVQQWGQMSGYGGYGGVLALFSHIGKSRNPR